MTKQKKLAEAEEYETPLQTLLSFLRVPHKIYREIYISVVVRRLSLNPLIQNDASIALLAREVGVEPALMSEKVRSLIRMKWLRLEEAGNRQVNQIFVLSPIWRFKTSMNETKFAVALQEYKANITTDTEYQRSTEEIYTLMNSVCIHTKEPTDKTLCELSRWEECKSCINRNRSKEGSDTK